MNLREPLGEEQLDALLNTFFLQENGSEADLAAAQFVLAQEYAVPIDPKKERELLARLNRKTGRGGARWLFLLLLPALAVSAYLFFFQHNRAERGISAGGKQEEQHPNVTSADSAGTPAAPVEKPKAPLHFFPVAAAPPVLQPGNTSADFGAGPVVPPDAAPAAPLFTEAELVAYGKLKTALLDMILGIDERLFTRVEEGKVKYAGRTQLVDAFVIRNYAITNREYTTFLADLVKNGRKEELAAAMVHSEGWSDYQCAKLAAEYAHDERYADFPVVNISREGAVLYCSWLEKELNAFAKAKNPKARTLNVRLPYDYEWIYAARTGYAEVPDCMGYNTIYDPREGLVDKSFLRRIAQVKKMDQSSATPMDALFALNRYGMSESEVLRIFDQGIRYRTADTLYTANVAAYNKAGHVSELIQDPAGKPVVMGACWKTKADYQAMLDAFNKRGGSPYVGFRVVITGGDKGSYKNPFW